MLFDTDALIWALRGYGRAATLIDRGEERTVSVVSYMELLQGAKNKQESVSIKAFLSETGFEMTPLTENIGHRAAIYMEEFGLKSGMGMADALLAATAAENNLTQCAANRRHYRVVGELRMQVFRP